MGGGNYIAADVYLFRVQLTLFLLKLSVLAKGADRLTLSPTTTTPIPLHPNPNPGLNPLHTTTRHCIVCDLSGEQFPFSVILDDPLGDSYIEALTDGGTQSDKKMKVGVSETRLLF